MFVFSKGVVSAVERGGTNEGKGEELPTQTVLRESRKQKEDRGRESQFYEDLQTFRLASCV